MPFPAPCKYSHSPDGRRRDGFADRRPDMYNCASNEN